MQLFLLRNQLNQTIGAYSTLQQAIEQMQQYIYKAEDESILNDLFNLLLEDETIQTGFTIEVLKLNKDAVYSCDDENTNYTLKHVFLNQKTLQVSIK